MSTPDDLTKKKSKNKNRKKIIDYFRDKSLETKDDDQFKHQHYVKVLKDILLKSETPINIGLYGKWGVGKSSIVHMLKEAIDDEKELKEFKYVEVDAWGLSHTSLQQGILEEINIQLNKVYEQNEIEDLLYNVQEIDSHSINNTIKRFWWMWLLIIGIGSVVLVFDDSLNVVTKLSAIGISSILALLLPITKLFLGTSKRIIPRAISSFQFNKIYEKIIKKQNKKIVVVIDNLDRCDDKIAVDLLGLIQTFMVKKNCINILACDDEAIISHLRNVKGKEYTDRDGNEFLSKFFQVTLRIPPFIGENLEKYTEDLIHSRSVKFSPFVRNILISGAIENPRKINQFLNNAVALFRLSEFKENDQKLPIGVITKHTDFLTKMIVIRHEWPEFYKAIEEKPEIMNDPEILHEWLSSHSAEQYHTKLSKFLNATQFSYVDDVIPFLRLNQESFAAESGIEEFANAVNTLDPKSEELFSKSEPEKQNQYLKKIETMMDKNELLGDDISQVSCALSLMGVLKFIEEKEKRDFALAILGKHFSNLLLNQWDKFDIEKHDLFSLLEEMLPRFSKPYYTKLVSQIFESETINEKLFNQFLKNGSKIPSSIMNKIDSEFGKIVSSPVSNLELLLKCCNEYNWNENNISKPSNTLDIIISAMTFNPDGADAIFRDTYQKIENNINSSERERYLKKIISLILQFSNANQILPELLITSIQQLSDDSLDENLTQKEKLFETLSKSIENNPDVGQNEIIINIVINQAQKFKNLANTSIDVDARLESTIGMYLDKGDHNTILNFFKKIESEGHEFLKSPVITSIILERFIQIGPNNADIFRFLLKNTPYESRQTVEEKFNELIQSEDPAQYSTLLVVGQELDDDFNSNLITSIRNACKEIINDENRSDQFTFYQHVLKLNPTYSEINSAVNYAEILVQNEEPETQNQGLELLNTVNSISNNSDPPGLDKVIDKSIELIKDNSERIVPYLAFIYRYKDKFTYSHKRKLKDLFKKGLKPEITENILNNIIAYLKQSPADIVGDLFDELITCAEDTTFANAKEQSKLLLILYKDELRSRQKDEVERIFGKDILD